MPFKPAFCPGVNVFGNMTQERRTAPPGVFTEPGSLPPKGRGLIPEWKIPISEPRLSEWASAEYAVEPYDAGSAGTNGGLYQYAEGKTLRINGEPVMDTCERPWCEATVREMFKGISNLRTDGRRTYEAPRILELGYGLGITSLNILQGLNAGMVSPGSRGGEYMVVELNEKLTAFARKTITDRVKRLDGLEESSWGGQNNIRASIIQGDAYDTLEVLAAEVREGKRKPFDGVVSDLYDPNQSYGLTDLRRMDLMREILADDGVFSFFVYYKGARGSGTNAIQEEILDKYGFKFTTSTVPINPNKNYEYLMPEGEDGVIRPIRRLTVITCHKDPLWRPATPYSPDSV